MAVRTFTDADTTRIWDLLNELGGVINAGTPQPHIERSMTTTITIPSGLHVFITHQTEDRDEGIAWAGGAYQAPSDGLYLLRSAVRFSSNDLGSRYAGVFKGAVFASAEQVCLNGTAVNAATGGSDMCEVTCVRRLVAGDYVWFSAYQSSGGPLDLSTAESATRAEMTRIAP